MAPSARSAAWTVAEAAEQFALTGVPVEAERLRLIIRGLGWVPCVRGRSGPKGGRGEAMYPIGDWQRLHQMIRPWIAAQGPLAGRDPDGVRLLAGRGCQGRGGCRNVTCGRTPCARFLPDASRDLVGTSRLCPPRLSWGLGVPLFSPSLPPPGAA